MKSTPMTAVEMGRKGGQSRSPAKVAAARRNAIRSALLRMQRKHAKTRAK